MIEDHSQLSGKKVGGISATNPLQDISYAYNIRGWMTKINDPHNLSGKLFGYEMKYTNPVMIEPKFNGNIAEVDWKTSADNNLKRYDYRYDALNRLMLAHYREPYSTVPYNNFYNEEVSYDINGNITFLKRNRQLANFGAQLMDDLTYVYSGNQLNTVTDSSSNYFGYPESSGNLIHYDPNGNMTDHLDKGILDIQYNFLNLPNYVKFDQYVVRDDPFGFGLETKYKNTTYKYRADGVKLKKVHNYFAGRTQLDASTTTEYLDGFQYSNEIGLNGNQSLTLQFVPTSEGYFDFIQNKYIYQYKDQIGNVRLSYYKNVDGNPKIDRTTDYYPFGLEFGGSLNIAGSVSPTYTYAFQEQEKQLDTGWSSFKWRNYDPTIGRFFNIDPLSEKYSYQSHYNFSENRVVDGRELEGLEVVLLKDTPHNKPIIKAANNGQYTDNANTKTIHVFAHGNPSALYNENGKKGETTIDSGAILNKTLNQNSELWKNSESKEGFTVVLHSCRTGRCTVDKSGNIIESVAAKISESKEMKGVTIIAPDERDGFSNKGTEVGPQSTYSTDRNGDYLPKTPRSEQGRATGQFGKWNSFQNGQQVSQQPGNTKPTGQDQRSWWDRIFN